MIHLLYNIALILATPLILLYSTVRSRLKGRRREGLAERCGIYGNDRLAALGGGDNVWVHAVSVGETIAVRPLLKVLKERFPGSKIVLSNVTETGRSIAEKAGEVDHCLYFPLDYPFTARRALAQVRPRLVIIVETEIWPNFLRAANSMGIPTVLVNGRISDRSFGRYLRFRWFFRPVLADLTTLCMQTEEDARRIIAIGADPKRVSVTRNLKYDIPVTALTDGRNRTLRNEYNIPEGAIVITAGSTHSGEEKAVISAYLRLLTTGRECFLILVPRHPERGREVAEIIASFGMRSTLRSRMGERSDPFVPGEVLLVDTVGELMGFYSISDLVFVGGSLVPTGGHNILEPVSQGVAVIFGPHMENFRESAAMVLESGSGFQVKNGEELFTVLQRLMDDGEERNRAGMNGMQLIRENGGAIELHMDVIGKFLRSNG